ncbi:MAG TPA: hypothetical protein VHT91_12895 [Kofleriaceae bacterium]|jgi:hypothetical protein|nr:hypothetical protein [Kofleriaceae bacterium]
MTRAHWLTITLALVGGCKQDAPPDRTAGSATPPGAAASAGATGSAPADSTTSNEPKGKDPKVADPHFRELLVAIADSRACQEVRNTFHSLRSSDAPDTVTGELWIRECNIESHGTHLKFHFAGDGWQRVDQSTKKLGAKFSVNEYVRFHASATLEGTLDLAYEPKTHIATLWFKPTRSPDVKFDPPDKVDVDTHGLWSSIIGGIAKAVGKAPEKEAKKQVEQQGQQAFASKLDDGMTVTFNACSGSTRSQFGLLAPGTEAPLDVGDTTQVEIELKRGGVLIFGPEFATRPVSIDVRASSGPVHVEAACAAETEKLAKAYVAGEPLPQIETIASAQVTGHRQLALARPRCPYAVILRSEGGTVSLRWKREPPPGAALIDCPEHQANPETAPHAPATPRNTPATPGPHGSK